MMKEFEKWNKTHRINDMRLLTEPDINTKEKQRRKAWRAALEWLLGGLDYSTEHEEIKDRIHDELEND